MKTECYYCNTDLTHTNCEYCILSEAIKPPKTPYRWKPIGYVCDTCSRDGQPTRIDEYKKGDRK